MVWLCLVGLALAISSVEHVLLGNSYGFDSDLTPATQQAGAQDLDLALALAVLAGLFGSAITFLRWMRMAYGNVRSLGYSPRFGAGQVYWSWFVPILNFWRPKQLVNDIWRSGDPAAKAPYGPKLGKVMTPGWLLAWWLLLLVPTGGLTDDSIGSWLLTSATLSASAFLCAAMVVRASNRQAARDARLAQEGFPT